MQYHFGQQSTRHYIAQRLGQVVMTRLQCHPFLRVAATLPLRRLQRARDGAYHALLLGRLCIFRVFTIYDKEEESEKTGSR